MIKNYPGAKEGGSAYQTIINLIPPHDVYIEPYLGSGAIYRHKKPALLSVLNDIDEKVVSQWSDYCTNNLRVNHMPALDLLKTYDFKGKRYFVYLDPPYPISSRRSRRNLYKYEMSDSDHIELLDHIQYVKYNCMISTYSNDIYEDRLSRWNKTTFQTQTRQGPATEVLYYNYGAPQKLHDYNYLGKDFIDRQRIKRKITRHINKLNKLPRLERLAILDKLNYEFRNELQ